MTTKVTAKGQITLPRWVREALGLRPGSFVRFVLRKGHVHMLATEGSVADALAGSLKAYARKRIPAAEDADRERVRKEVAHAAAVEGLPRRHPRSS